MISPERKLRDKAVISSNVRGCGWVGVCEYIFQRKGIIKVVSTYDAAITSPQILTAERGTVGIAESPIWEFVPCSRIIDLASAYPSFIGYV